jgi:adenosyl cobinamide kinase/adenosyl cobinamide phosphate guanylyltransferase/NaMN:DMB phosphoribosyltransferase
MSWQLGRRFLVLGGIRSGKSGFAERLVEQLVAGSAGVRYVATAAPRDDDPEWEARIAAHRARRPSTWATEELGTDPGRLISLLAEAKPDDALLIDDLGGWLTATLDVAGGWAESPPPDGDDLREAPEPAPTPGGSLAAAVRACPAALLVLVSPEVGLSVVPATVAGRVFADGIGEVNQAVATECDAVALVVAGQPTWLKSGPEAAPRRAAPTTGPAAAPTAGPVLTPATGLASTAAMAAATATPAEAPAEAAAQPAEAAATTPAEAPAEPAEATAEPAEATAEPAAGAVSWADAETAALPVIGVGAAAAADTGPIAVGMTLPMPDDDAAAAAGERLSTLAFAGSGLGALAPIVRFAAGTQGQPVPRPWPSVRMFLLHADHDGGVSAGDSPAASAARLEAVERGEGAWALLAGAAGVGVQTVRCPGSGAAIEYADALRESDVETALRYGWQLAESAVDAGTDLIVLGASGAGADAAAVALIVTATSGEVAALLGPVIAPGGRIDDVAWMRRCAAVRDALHRVRSRARDPQTVLGMLGGADHAVAAGLLLGAVSRRTPVLLDGPVGIAAALIARDFGAQTRHWILVPDTGGHPAVRLGAEVLGATPVLDLKLGIGEGATALAALPLLRSALALAASS